MDANEIAALIQLAERGPLSGAERLWLAALKLAVARQLEEQARQANAEQEKTE
jgi:hypothetical protein